MPKNLKLPLRDGDTEKDDENYEGCYFLNANASESRRPKIIDRACNDVLDQDEVYSGCYAKVKIGLFSYSASGNKGIAQGWRSSRRSATASGSPAATPRTASRS